MKSPAKSASVAWLMCIGLMASLGASLVAHGNGVKSVSPDPKLCRPPTAAEVRWLDEQWKGFLPFVRVCPIRDTRSKTVLLLVSAWAELFYADKPSGTPTVSMPRPLLFLPTGARVGVLPMNYPDDPPHTLAVEFTAWRHGFPERIDARIESPTASGGRKLPPMVWDPKTRRYVEQP